MLWTIIVVLFVLWLLGTILEIGGGMLSILLIAAAVLFVYNLFAGRSRA